MVKTIGQVEAGSFIKKNTDVVPFVLNVTGTTSTVDISNTNNNAVYLENVGATDCYITFGATATTAGLLLQSGTAIELQDINFNNVSAITSTGTTTVNVIVTRGQPGQKGNAQILNLSVTNVSSNATFTNTTMLKDILIINEGSTNCFTTFGATATTSDLLLKSKEAISVSNVPKHQIAAITATGTTIVKVLGIW